MSGQSHRHRGPSLEEASSGPIQLVDLTGGLDEFAPEPVLMRIEPPGAPTSMPTVVAGGTDVRWVLQSRFDWTRAALVSSVLVAAIAGILVLLQPPTTPLSAVDPTERMTDSAPQPTVADSPPAAPLAVWTAPSASPSPEAPVPSEVVPPPRANVPGTPSGGARDANGRPIQSVLAPSASLGGSETIPVPSPRGLTTIGAPADALATPAESPAAAAASSSPSIPLVAAATLAPNAATSNASPPALSVSRADDGSRAPAPAEPSRSADVPVNAVAAPTGRDLDARAIEDVLGQYRSAFNRLDVGAAVAVWPTVNEKTLARAFERLDDQDVSFESCTIEVGGVHAEAACSGTARYVPKVGSRTPRAEARRWKFVLRKASDGWRIDQIDAR